MEELLELTKSDKSPKESTRLIFYNLSLLDKDGLNKVFQEQPKIKSVIHFAGLKVRQKPF